MRIHISEIIPQKYFPVVARVRIQAPHAFTQKLIPQDFFPACIGFVPGGIWGTTTFGSTPPHLDCHNPVGRVPWICPTGPTDILSNVCTFARKSVWDVPDVPGAVQTSPGQLQGIPTSKFLTVCLVYQVFLYLALSAHPCATFKKPSRTFQTSSAMIVAICGHFSGT